MKRLASAAASLILAVPIAWLSAPSAAHASTWCDPHSSTSGGMCVSVSGGKYHEKVLDSVPIRNKSSKTIHASCKFSDTVSVKVSYGVKVSAGVKGQIFGLAEASAGVEFQTSIELSASAAREAAGSFDLKPHQAVICQRTYGYYTYTVKLQEWGSDHKIHTTKKTAKMPYTLGATFIDG